jgi:flagellar L-ring protein precursor FlgH
MLLVLFPLLPVQPAMAGSAARGWAENPALAQIESESRDAPREVMEAEQQVADLIREYLRASTPTSPANRGPAFGWATGLWTDHRARQINDLITVQVLENVVGSGSADSSLAKDGSLAAALPNFFGLESVLPSALDPLNLVTGSDSSDFTGGGSTTRAGTLRAVVTARVADVLPNGNLVLQGIREVEINGDRQVMVLTGLVRTQDVGPNNVVLSPAVGQLRIRYFGTGLIKDTLQPGWLTRIFNKIF